MTEQNDTPKPAAPPVPAPAPGWIGVQISKKTYLVIHAVLILPYFLLGGYFLARSEWAHRLFTGPVKAELAPASAAAKAALIPDQVSVVREGPWGKLEYIPIYISCPQEFLNVRSYETMDRRWFFNNYTPDQMAAFFNHASLTEEQKQELLNATKWEVTPAGIYLDPSRELRLALSPAARRHIYPVLAQFSDAFQPIAIRSEEFEDHFENSGVAPETIALVRQLCYPHGKLLFLSNLPMVLDTLPNYADKVKLIKAISRKRTMLLQLHITPGDDIKAVAKYWTKAVWGKDLEPLLESVSEVPGGARLSIMNLLPPLATSLLNTFPLPSLESSGLRQDCHWTSMNFFRDTPEPRFGDTKFANEALLKDYYPVVGDPTYGDVVCFLRPNGAIIHSAVFIADNIAYTKNGGHFLQPWLLMTIPDLQERYTAVIPENEQLQIRYFRNKYY